MRILKYVLSLLAVFTVTSVMTSCGDDDDNVDITVQKYDQARVTVYVAVYENQLQYVYQNVQLGVNGKYQTVAWTDMTEVSVDAVPDSLRAVGVRAADVAAGTVESNKVRYYSYVDPTVYNGAAGYANVTLDVSQGEPDEELTKERFNLLVAAMAKVTLTDSKSDVSSVIYSKLGGLEAFIDIDSYFEELGDAAKYLDGIKIYVTNF